VGVAYLSTVEDVLKRMAGKDSSFVGHAALRLWLQNYPITRFDTQVRVPLPHLSRAAFGLSPSLSCGQSLD
jgi:hypothetical protein